MDKSAFMKGIGDRLKELRGNRTQESISKALDVILGEERTKEAYQHYEGGRRLLPSDVLWGLSQIYGVSADWILSGGKSLRRKAEKMPEISSEFDKDATSTAKLIQSLSTEQRKAIKIILNSIKTKHK